MAADRNRGADLDALVFEQMASSLPPVAPPAALRSRLMDAALGPARYLPFCADLAEQFALRPAEMRALLSQIDEPGRWTPGIEPIQGFLDFRPGPALRGMHGGFVRMRQGMHFPLHRHRQRELTYVLEGTLVDGHGERRGPGQAFDMAAGSAHSLTAVGTGDSLVALLHGGIDMLGE